MKNFRFIATTEHHVSAETLDEAIEVFSELKHGEEADELTKISRIDVLDENEEYVPVDRPMRAEYVQL
jgi:hypothetical protein